MALFTGYKTSGDNGNGNGAASAAAVTTPTNAETRFDQALDSPVFKSVPPGATAAIPAVMNISADRQTYLTQLRVKLHQKLVEKLNVQNLRTMPANVVRQECRSLIRDLFQTEKGLLTSAEQERLMDDIMDETFGLGPLEQCSKDPTVSDILVNRFDKVYVERRGVLEKAEVPVPRQPAPAADHRPHRRAGGPAHR
jgi:hypothetical protein